MGLSTVKLPVAIDSEEVFDSSYLSHFQTHVRHLLPGASLDGCLQSPCLRFAVLCISASNLSMLNARTQSRVVARNDRESVFSPLVNTLHHSQARKYHDLALWHCQNAQADEIEHQAPALLAAHVLLAYYHHASTNHLNFRLAVLDSVRFVMLNRTSIMGSPGGSDSLQMWYRLCTSHRPAKPPALLLEGEGASSFGPNLLPDASEHLYLNCILGMSSDDLIYDILIKTMEIKTKLVVYRCVAGSYNVSEQFSEIGSLAHGVLNKMLGRHCEPDECVEAREGFVRGSHLLGLLDVQKERLKVWKSRLTPDQLPIDCASDLSIDASSSICQTFPTHRDAMNASYCMLCEIIFEAHGPTSYRGFRVGHHEHLIGGLAHGMCQIAGTLDFTTSNTLDVYTFSLAEVLLQLVFLYQSEAIFHCILDTLWPQLEIKGKGFEHSHYPTHLVKRIITQIAAYWAQARAVNLALPAVPEDMSKLKLLDINHPVNLVVCGHNKDGNHFIERVPLP